MTIAIKTIGPRGQLRLSKKYAGQQVLVDESEPGVWTIKTGKFIPDNERWMWTAETQAQIDHAIAWAEQHPPTETDLESLAGQIGK
jgi:hypothetical protein